MWNFHASWFLVLEFPIGVTQFLRNFYEQSFFCLESPRLKWQTSKFQGSLFFLIFIIVQNKQKCLYTLNHFLFVCSFLLVLHLTITRLAISSSTVFHFTFMVLDGFLTNFRPKLLKMFQKLKEINPPGARFHFELMAVSFSIHFYSASSSKTSVFKKLFFWFGI